ncbi:MAG: ParB N-terminal domain-containing protein, partial [Anaerolineales bacterium]
MPKRTTLGRGLDALIPTEVDSMQSGGIRNIPIDQIIPNPHQPRTQFNPEELSELANSIREHGIL